MTSLFSWISIVAIFASACLCSSRRVITNVGSAITNVGSAADAATSAGFIAYHPGHPPHHVTRLHRYDHSGMAAMLEAEATWSRDILGKERNEPRHIRGSIDAVGATFEEVAEGSSFVQVSERQSSALLEHHRALSSFLQLSALGASDGMHEGIVDENADARIDVGKLPTDRSTKDVITTGLSNLNSQYVGPIGVGTITECPRETSLLNQTGESLKQRSSTCQAGGQSKVWVVFDTGSTNIWINSVLCQSGPCSLPDRHMYNHSASETYAAPVVGNHVTVQFGTGTIQGPQAVDDFRIGPFTVKQQTFAMIENATGSVFKEVAFEGIVGLAFPKMSANGVVPFFDTVINQKALEHNEFAFYLSKENPSANAIFWGGVDNTFYNGELEYFPVVDPFYWSLKLVSFKLGGKEIMGHKDTYEGYANADRKWNGPVAIVDTGTTFFTLEKDKFKQVMKKLPRIKCSRITAKTYPPMTITLESSTGRMREFTLQHKQYMASNGKGKDAKCSPAFMQVDLPEEHAPGMILGEVFLRHHFAVFDRGSGKEGDARVALAEAADHEAVHARLHHLTSGQPNFHDDKVQRKDPQ